MAIKKKSYGHLKDSRKQIKLQWVYSYFVKWLDGKNDNELDTFLRHIFRFLPIIAHQKFKWVYLEENAAYKIYPIDNWRSIGSTIQSRVMGDDDCMKLQCHHIQKQLQGK